MEGLRNMEKKKTKKRSWIVWAIPIVIVTLLIWMTTQLLSPSVIDTSEGLQILKSNTVKRAVVNDGTQQVTIDLTENYTPKVRSDSTTLIPPQPTKWVTFTYTRAQAEQVDELIQKGSYKDGFNSIYPTASWWSSILQMLLIFGVFFAILLFFTSKMQGGAKFMSFGKSKVRKSDDAPKVKFEDVAGEDEAVEELQEIREFLSIPQKFHALGAKIPKGVLLYGPPGTGKTLLAKAVAGEAGVPFYSMSGSEFVEMFVGVGASRVRDLFDQAKEHAPSIIFVDEIDAVGRNRGSGVGGGNDEREQTLNQLLVEMDGFDENTNVIMIAATNRPDVLDPALLRPGRFDRQIAVEAPDLKGREAILHVHAKGKPMTKDVDLATVAKRTPGFTGADLANVLNEAALLTARSNADLIDNRALDEAIDRVIAGPQKRTRVMNPHDKAVTAYHEGGHALCAAALNYTDPVTKVTILPRGRALGYTMVMPTEDRYNKTRNQLLDELVYALGGRVAEELIFLDPSTGASNDIQKATKTARALVSDYGMSSHIGPVKHGHEDTQPFLGKEGFQSRDYSEATASMIDNDVRTLMDNAMREAWQILSRNREVLDTLAQRLIEKETLLEAELDEIFQAVVKQPQREHWSYASDAAVPGTKFGDPILEPPTNQPDVNKSSGARSANNKTAVDVSHVHDAATKTDSASDGIDGKDTTQQFSSTPPTPSKGISPVHIQGDSLIHESGSQPGATLSSQKTPTPPSQVTHPAPPTPPTRSAPTIRTTSAIFNPPPPADTTATVHTPTFTERSFGSLPSATPTHGTTSDKREQDHAAGNPSNGSHADTVTSSANKEQHPADLDPNLFGLDVSNTNGGRGDKTIQ